MLKNLTIKNFQKHKNLEIEFDPKVTVITGPTDRGKSSIIRALKWLMTNKPSGSAFIRYGSKKVSADLLYDEGGVIRRERGPSTNLYSLNDTTFTAFGNDVPAPILESLNISEINFQGQHDPLFWFSETAGEISRQLNKIIDLEIVDSTLLNIASDLRKANAEVSVLVNRVQATNEHRKSLKYILDIDKDLQEVESLEKDLRLKSDKTASLGTLLEQVKSYQDRQARATDESAHGEQVLSVGFAWLKINEKSIELERLLAHIKYEKTKTNIEIPKIDHLDSLKTAAETATMNREKIEDLLNNIHQARKNAREYSNDLMQTEEIFHEKLGDICPLCDSPLTK